MRSFGSARRRSRHEVCVTAEPACQRHADLPGGGSSVSRNPSASMRSPSLVVVPRQLIGRLVLEPPPTAARGRGSSPPGRPACEASTALFAGPCRICRMSCRATRHPERQATRHPNRHPAAHPAHPVASRAAHQVRRHQPCRTMCPVTRHPARKRATELRKDRLPTWRRLAETPTDEGVALRTPGMSPDAPPGSTPDASPVQTCGQTCGASGGTSYGRRGLVDA